MTLRLTKINKTMNKMNPIKCNWCGYDITHYFDERPIPNINDDLKEFLCGACLNQYEKKKVETK